MFAKLVSLASAITVIGVAARSQLDPNAPLYNFASGHLWVNIIMVLVAGLSVAISFKRRLRFNSWYGYVACMALASLLILVGILGVYLSNFILDGWDLLLPLNYLMLLESGIVLAVCGLSYRHPKRPVSISRMVYRLAPSPKAPALAAANGIKSAYRVVKESGATISARSPSA